jgi:cellobiose-specific phosphotransferase system component IIB
MGAGLFKALEIQKQLQEKAKAISQQKTEAQQALDNIKNLIETLKKLDIDTKEISSIYTEIENFFKTGNFQEVIFRCNTLNSDIMGIFKKEYSVLKERVNQINLILKNLKKEELLFDEADKAFNQGIYKDSLLLIHDLLVTGKNEIAKYLDYNINKISEDEKDLTDIDKTTVKGLKENVNEKLSKGEFEEAINILKKIYGIVYKEEYIKIGEYKNKIEDISKIKKELGIEGGITEVVSFDSDPFYNPKEVVKEYEDTYEIAYKEVTNKLKEYLEDVTARYDMARQEGIESDVIAISIKKAKEYLKEEDVIAIIPQLKIANAELKKVVINKFAVELEKIKPDLVTASQMGMSNAEIISTINEARSLLQKGSISASFEKLRDTKNKLKYMLSSVKELREKAKEVDTIINSLKSLNVSVDDLVQMYDDAISAINQTNLTLGEALLKKAKEKVWEYSENTLLNIIEKAQQTERDAKILRINTDLISEQIRELTESIRNKDIKKSILLARSLKIEEAEIMKHFSTTLSEEVGSIISKMDKNKQTEWLNKANEVKELLDKGQYSDAIERAKGIRNELNALYKSEGTQFLDELKNVINFMKTLKMDTSAYESSFSQIMDLYNKELYINAHRSADELTNKIHKEVSKHISKEFTLAKIAVIEAKKVGVNVEQFKKMLEEVSQLTEKGSYKDAIDLMIKVKTDAIKARESNQRAIGEISKVASIISDIKNYGVNVQPYVAKLYEAKDFFDKGEYEKSIALAKEIYNDSLKDLNTQKIKIKIKEFDDRIKEISNYGFDVSNLQEIMNNTMKLVDASDYDGALSSVDWGLKEAYKMIKEGFQQKLSDLEKIINESKLQGIYVEDSEENIKNARIALESGLYDQSLEIIKQEEENIKNIRSEYDAASNALKNTKDVINSAEAIGVNVDNAKSMVIKINDLIKNRMYREAINYSDSTISLIKKQALYHVNSVIASLSNQIMKAKSSGRNTVIAENMHSRALAALSKGDFLEAFNYGMRCEGELETVELQYSTATGTVSLAEAKLNEIEKSGIMLPQARALLDKAKETLMRGDYYSALDYGIKVGDNINATIESAKKAAAILQNARDKLTDLYKLGVNIDSAVEYYNRAKDEMGKGNYDIVIEYSNKCTDEITVIINKFLYSTENYIDELINLADEFKLDATSGKQLYIEAKSVSNMGKYDRALELFDISKERLEALLTDKLNEELNNLRLKVKNFVDDGINLPFLDKDFDELKNIIDKKQIKEAFQKYKELDEKVKKEVVDVIKTAIDEMKRYIMFTDNAGMDVTEYMELMTQYNQNLSNGYYDGLYSNVMQSTQKLLDTIQKYVSDKLNEFWNQIDFSRKGGYSVKDAEALYASAKTKFKDNKFMESFEDIQNGMAILLKNIEMKKEIINLSLIAEEKIRTASHEGKDVSKAIALLESIESAHLQGKADNYQEIVNQLMNITNYITDKPLGEDNQEKILEDNLTVHKKEFISGIGDGVEKCFVCKGVIKKGLPLKRCPTCNTPYHEPCITRAKKCLVCNEPYL